MTVAYPEYASGLDSIAVGAALGVSDVAAGEDQFSGALAGTTPNPYTVLADWYVAGQFVRAGTVVSLVPGSSLYAAYGGTPNLAPLRQTGDDADHADLGN